MTHTAKGAGLAERWRSESEAPFDDDTADPTWHMRDRRSPNGSALCGMAPSAEHRQVYDAAHWRRCVADDSACFLCGLDSD